MQCLGLMTTGVQLYGFPVFTGSTIPAFLHNTMIKHFTYAFSNRILVKYTLKCLGRSHRSGLMRNTKITVLFEFFKSDICLGNLLFWLI